MANFGPTGETVFKRTYARPKDDGTLETWEDTALRVARGNLALVYGSDYESWPPEAVLEEHLLVKAISNFEIIPAGRHLWASGVPGRQFLFNCHAAGWDRRLSDHATFIFLRLMEGGGVGANYSAKYTGRYGAPKRAVNLELAISPLHADFQEAVDSGLVTQTTDSHAIWIGDSREGWADALRLMLDAAWATFGNPDAVTLRFNLSDVRPAGAPLKTFGGTASGPVPLARMLHDVADIINRAYASGILSPLDLMDIDHAIASCVVAGGVRRSARMSILHWQDPAIFEFIRSKTDSLRHWSTNISVEVDDEFFAALNGPYSDPGTQHALAVHRAVVAGMLENGEPGYWNSSLSQEGEVETVETTNPCGEIALQPWENCNLGHVNLEAFADRSMEELERAHILMTRFLIRATFGDVTSDRQRAILDRNRRIGVGHFGVQGYLVRQGLRYSDAADNAAFKGMLEELYEVVRTTAHLYAFQLRIPEPIKVTTVAPTGSVAKLPGATEGLHPVYARYFLRRIRFSMIRESEMEQVREYERQGYRVDVDPYAQNTLVVTIPTKERLVDVAEKLGYPADIVEDVSELSLETLLRFQAVYQEAWADNAISMTINLPPEKYTEAEVAQSLAEYLPQLKGVTIMTDGTRPMAPYERISREEYLEEAARLGIDTVDDAFDENCASGACPVK